MASLVVSAYNVVRDKTEKSHVLYHAKRAIFPLIIGTVVLSGLLFSSTVAYFIFYWSYIPSVGIARDIHLQFSRDAAPWGSVDLATTGMLSDQPYAAFVELELPRSKNNLELGNFMVSLSLLNPFNVTLATSARPAILTYTSPLISTSLTFLNAPLLITGFKKESETLLIPIMERFEFTSARASRPRYAFVEIIPDAKIQVYSAKLMFVAQFEGVRWFMYSHRIIAFGLFTSLFFISSSLFAGLTWFIFSLRSSAPADELHHEVTQEGKEMKQAQIKAPPDDDQTISPSTSSSPAFTRLSSTGGIQIFPPVTELSTKEELRQSMKPSRSESVASEQRSDDIGSTSTQLRTDDEMSGYTEDDDVETVARYPVSDVTF